MTYPEKLEAEQPIDVIFSRYDDPVERVRKTKIDYPSSFEPATPIVFTIIGLIGLGIAYWITHNKTVLSVIFCFAGVLNLALFSLPS